jgi:hypothetical protein
MPSGARRGALTASIPETGGLNGSELNHYTLLIRIRSMGWHPESSGRPSRPARGFRRRVF